MVALIHAALEQKLQSNGAFVFGAYSKYQYDFILTEVAYEFIKRYARKKPFWNERLEDSPVGHEGINSLIERTTINLSVHNEDEHIYVGQLPPDYLMLVDDSLHVFCNCKEAVNVSDTTDVHEYICVFEVPSDIRVDRVHDFFEDFSIVLFNQDLTTSTIYDTDDYPSLENGIENNEERYILTQHILNNFSNKDGNFYYEYYRGKFYPGKLIYVLKNPIKVPLALLTYFGVTASEYIYFEDLGTFSTASESTNASEITSAPRLIRHADTSNLRTHPFGKTSKNSPLSNIDRKQIYYYGTKNIVPTTVDIVYIKRPLYTCHITNEYSDIYEEYKTELTTLAASALLAYNNADTNQITARHLFNQ